MRTAVVSLHKVQVALLKFGVVHRPGQSMGFFSVLGGLCQVAAQHLQVSMSHQALQVKDIHAGPQAGKREQPPE